jgi:aryl-alcohol dehydrogenase-like predicted oxidoreductase
VHVDSEEQREALSQALRAGVNLVDTSTNYGDGGSERLVGRVLADAVQQGAVRRDQVVVVSKAGYVQGGLLEEVRTSEHGYPEIVEVSPVCWHCIHPDFLGDQLERSLERLGLERLDVLLLHNPEYALGDRLRREGRVDGAAREVFYGRIRAAFGFLEEAVGRGLISHYGVSSNRFASAATDPLHASLDRMVSIARDIAGDGHHFAVAELPMNLLELGAVSEREETGDGAKTVLEVAAAADVGVLANRPLNALVMRDGRPQLVRIGGVDGPEAMAEAEARLSAVCELEAVWAEGLGRELRTEEGEDAVDLFRWGRELSGGLAKIRDPEQWQRTRREIIAPHLGEASATLLTALEGETREAFRLWWQEYGAALHEAFVSIEAGLEARAAHGAHEIESKLDPLLPPALRALPLRQKAILCLLGAPISSVLVGMRRVSYVHDVLAIRELSARLHPGPAEADDAELVDLLGLAAALAQ